MRFGVLGPLGVWTADGRPVRVPELKVRALLTCLLAHQGRPVSADRLIDDLWGAKLPGNPAGVLQNKVWQLRRALEAAEPGGRDLVVSLTPLGYRLRTGSDAVDADRFHELTARARAAGDPRERAALLADALAVWRGPAFADFADEEFVRAAAARLEEQRLTALEEQAEARLELGEHALVADDLGDLVALHPLRERLRTAHVRALYLAGRQSAALSSYAELRERLADQLGLDPSPELAALHQAILTQDPALTAVPSPSTTAARPPSNVPSALTELIGRGEAVAGLRAALDAHRLVTLTGPGGVGKTRLALAVAAQAAPAFPGGVRLAELAALDPSPGPLSPSPSPRDTEVRELVAALLGVRDDISPLPSSAAGPPTLTDRVVQALGDQPTLLVLDNCEHVVAPVAELVERLLKSAPRLRVLATSQIPLGVAGERLSEVEPLDRPGAVELFAARASAAAPHFVLDESNAEAVAAICRRLDGIPLAVEMAATRVRVLGVAELAARLDDRFHLLASGVRGAPARQRTLRAVIDWSWDLLGDQERAVLRRLAVHADGCTLAAAEEICPAGDLNRAEVLDLLARLVEGSLVVVADTADGPRYRLLESVTAYCVERLRENGELTGLQLRHQDYYTGLAERAEPHLRGHGQRQWLRRLDAENANLRTALESAVRAGDAERALRLVNALSWYWQLRGRNSEAERSLAQALSVPAPAPADPAAHAARVAKATAWLGGVRLALGGSADPLSEYRAALRPYGEYGEYGEYEKVDDPGGRARAQWFLGSNLYGIADLSPSEELVARALAAFRSLGDEWGTAAALASRAFQAKLRGDFDAVRRHGEQSLEIFRELGDQWGQLRAMVPLQTRAEVVGDYPHAGRLLRDGLRMAEELELWPEVSFQLAGLGRITLLTGDLPQAREYHERARRLAVEQSDTFGELFAEIGLGMGARREGDLEAAEAHMVHVLALHRQMGYEPGMPALVLAELGFIAEARGQVERALELQLDGLATARAAGDPRALALALEGLAGARLLSGHPAHAARLLGAATTARASVGVPLPLGERGDVDRISTRARRELGESAYGTEFTRGTTLTPAACAEPPAACAEPPATCAEPPAPASASA
ncbi:BTAD domain-containing putative transcriptional regulator [Streptomyces jumonjinensis]|uniref:AfsR/SARP family transcriptional regulator n=1 Tax=Streptomyces jumonjinensis TaxID=1945 RepID=A0A646KGD2_STRJU|nr:BTAD domain-containing putative transcriptional regulator [Streptomyces jumonjinensis]MQT01283.1 AfsR/SARP family transcriptional regulator [Streptomyces jumonjinensis]